ncbi:hypothetical protein ABZ345_19005 [Lentzea sp. NPDC005914]|uniref:hypothetical protein n=1 Tax=Lentzea sp. NPDC005914 TaxID=3154572 RepID=UPI0033E6BA36
MNPTRHTNYCAMAVQIALVKVIRIQAAEVRAGRLKCGDVFDEYRRTLAILDDRTRLTADLWPWDRWKVRRAHRRSLRDVVRAAKQHRRTPH